MGQGGRIVALGLTLIVGGLGGALIMASTQKVPTLVTQTVAADPVTISVTATVVDTVTAEPGPSDDPAGPKANGSYLIGSQMTPGTWQCARAGGPGVYWAIRSRDGGLLDNGLTTIATIQGGDIGDLQGCAGSWTLVG